MSMHFTSRRRPIPERIAGAISAVLGVLALSACQDPGPEAATWARVSQILDEHGCAQEGACHSVERADANLVLELDRAYDQLVSVACSNPGAEDSGLLRVVPGDVENSFLWTKVNLPGYSPLHGDRMPILGEGLSESELDILERWIEAGAPRD